ncbi:alpha/beta fold hydrolase [Microbacterium dauci]|uniref:Alpha/beta hydrolase n=1 Tax=Microbacterium dauci TaxID=3048008 RepID=A0ABT6ZAD5_9MICO|nr:alpha/beta hydrolase [Microbacterium sp. LX3-4]MDJ1113118.1 alpha/beta hydrolase [Microbacterium sp. LX3-4]
MDRRLERPTAGISYIDTGGDTGAVVLLVHGAGMDATMFDRQIDDLTQEGYRVIAPDLRGHGASSIAGDVRFTAADAIEDLLALLDTCGVARAVLVGHSLGGNLIQAIAHRYPERAVGLVVMDATPNRGPLSAIERVALRIAAPALALIPARTLPGLMARASAVTPDAIARTQALFERMPKRRFLDVWRATTSLVEPGDSLDRSPVPLALIRGAQDRTGNIASAMPRWAAREGIAEQVVPGAGHIVTWDAPEATSVRLLDTLGGWSRG